MGEAVDIIRKNADCSTHYLIYAGHIGPASFQASRESVPSRVENLFLHVLRSFKSCARIGRLSNSTVNKPDAWNSVV